MTVLRKMFLATVLGALVGTAAKGEDEVGAVWISGGSLPDVESKYLVEMTVFPADGERVSYWEYVPGAKREVVFVLEGSDDMPDDTRLLITARHCRADLPEHVNSCSAEAIFDTVLGYRKGTSGHPSASLLVIPSHDHSRLVIPPTE